MFFDHITFKIGDIGKNSGVFGSKTSVHGTVRELTFCFAFIVFFSVVVEKIVKQTGSCGGTGVKAEFFAYKIGVVRYVQAVLKTCRRDMVSYILESVKCGTVDNIADESIISVR